MSFVKPGDWFKSRPLPLPDSDYCKTCSYPLIPGLRGPCSRCEEVSELERKLNEQHAQAIGGMKGWREYTVQGFHETEYNREAFHAAKNFDPYRQNLLLWGPAGTGKSRLAGIAKRRWIQAGHKVITISMPEVVDELVANFKSQRFGNEWVERLINVPILSIEDVGAGEKMTEFVVKMYFRIVDGRYKADRRGLIMTTNHSLTELRFKLKQYDEPGRFVSRIEEMADRYGKILSLQGERDWRRSGSGVDCSDPTGGA